MIFNDLDTALAGGYVSKRATDDKQQVSSTCIADGSTLIVSEESKRLDIDNVLENNVPFLALCTVDGDDSRKLLMLPELLS